MASEIKVIKGGETIVVPRDWEVIIWEDGWVQLKHKDHGRAVCGGVGIGKQVFCGSGD